MVDGKQGVMAIGFPKGLIGAGNPIAQLPAKFKELEKGFNSWLDKQSLAVEASIVTATSAALGAAIGAVEGTLWKDVSCSFQPPPGSAKFHSQAMAYLEQAQSIAGDPWVQARNFAVITGVNAGISCVMRRIRGKEDVQSSMVAAFGSGALFSLVSGLGGPNQATNAVTSGLFFALVQGGLFRVTLGQKFSQPPTEDVKTKSLLSNLGLQNYEKNFKKDLLTSITLPLLTYSALRVVNIPPRPRPPILDDIQWAMGRNFAYNMRHHPILIGLTFVVGYELLKNLYARKENSPEVLLEISKRNESTIALCEKLDREIEAIKRKWK